MLDRYNNRKPSTGTLYLTATHLIFVDPDAKKETWVKRRGEGVDLNISSHAHNSFVSL